MGSFGGEVGAGFGELASDGKSVGVVIVVIPGEGTTDGVQPENRIEIHNNDRRYLFIAILLSSGPCVMKAKRIQLVAPIKKIAVYDVL